MMIMKERLLKKRILILDNVNTQIILRFIECQMIQSILQELKLRNTNCKRHLPEHQKSEIIEKK